jgi:hypothetical protein
MGHSAGLNRRFWVHFDRRGMEGQVPHSMCIADYPVEYYP